MENGPAVVSSARTRPAARRAHARPAGFTLIEVLAVVSIFAVLAGLLAPRVGAITGRDLQQRAKDLAAQLELARLRAVATGVPHRVLLDLEGGGYRIEWFVTENHGEDEVSAPTAYDLRGGAPIPTAPPRELGRDYRPIPSTLGSFTWIEDSLLFGGVETPQGWIERGDAAVEFASDGTATAASIYLDGSGNRSLVLEVRTLADSVRISDAS